MLMSMPREVNIRLCRDAVNGVETAASDCMIHATRCATDIYNLDNNAVTVTVTVMVAWKHAITVPVLLS